MITYTMTTEEVIKQMRSDEIWLMERSNGIQLKYRKTIKSIKTGYYVLGTTRYVTPQKNIVYVTWSVFKYPNNTYDMQWSSFYQYTTKAGVGYVAPVWVNNRLDNVTNYTAHCIERMNQRSGMTMMDYIDYYNRVLYGKTIISDYTYEGRTTKIIGIGDRGFFILGEGGWGMTAVTYISSEISSEDQCEQIEGCEAIRADDTDELYRTRIAENREQFAGVGRQVKRHYQEKVA